MDMHLPKYRLKVHVEPVGRIGHLTELFLGDGWEVEGAEVHLIASHPQVPDEEHARGRLSELGLLTSPALRIDFELRPGLFIPPGHRFTGRAWRRKHVDDQRVLRVGREVRARSR